MKCLNWDVQGLYAVLAKLKLKSPRKAFTLLHYPTLQLSSGRTEVSLAARVMIMVTTPVYNTSELFADQKKQFCSRWGSIWGCLHPHPVNRIEMATLFFINILPKGKKGCDPDTVKVEGTVTQLFKIRSLSSHSIKSPYTLCKTYQLWYKWSFTDVFFVLPCNTVSARL